MNLKCYKSPLLFLNGVDKRAGIERNAVNKKVLYTF